MRKVEAIFDDDCLSFPPDLNVRSIPPFFSGLGVLDPLLSFGLTICELVGGGESVAPKVAALGCEGELLVLCISLLELFLEVYDGLLGAFLTGNGGGLTKSW